MEYYFQIKKPSEFRYNVMNNVKDCLLIQREQEKLNLIRQAKTDLFKEIKDNLKDLKNLNSKLDSILVDDELKKEVKEEVKKESRQQKKETTIKELEEIKKPEIKISPKKPEIKQTITNENKIQEQQDAQERMNKNKNDMESFEYTLDQIEKKLAELKN